MAHTPTHRRESSEDRRQAIATAARALIVEKGMEGLRTRDIAERVGINIATLHYHVPTKEALVALVTETLREEFRAQSILRPRAHLTPMQQLEHEFFDFAEMLFERRDILIVMTELVERARRDPVVAEAIRPLKRKWLTMLEDMLAAGSRDGSFRPDLDPGPAAIMIVGALMQFCRLGDPSNDTYRRLCDELRRALANPAANKD